MMRPQGAQYPTEEKNAKTAKCGSLLAVRIAFHARKKYMRT
ncbi:hypothetical protein [Candidatus Proelusimicrobium excrementi]